MAKWDKNISDSYAQSHMILTEAEKQAWELFQQGLSRQEIAEKLNVKRNTVNVRIATARQKIQARQVENGS